ncbi:MAG TPA: VWA domain-containing protein [Acetobacteraceae bacterium]|nr:VWA domain-containing protein [Acetobacteraceae bacterium]
MAPSAESLIARRIAAFSATLRDAGFTLGLPETEDTARILASPLARTPTTLRPALRALFAASHTEWERFDAIFDAAFLGRRLRHAARISGAPPGPGPRSLRELSSATGTSHRDEATDATPNAAEIPTEGTGMQGGASPSESTAARDLRRLADPDRLAAAEAVARALAASLLARHTRRRRRARRHGRLDLRRTIRASLGHGGTPFTLAWRRPRPQPLRIALIIDVSGSMSPHTPLFLRLALGLVRSRARTEIFLAHTRLVAASDAMRDRDRARALDRLTLLSKGVGGGTRLGESLAQFNRFHAPRALAGRAVCLIVSDGYETGDPALLGREMAALRRRCRRLVWLNPAALAPGYEPIARGMQAALPHLRLFAPAGTLESLAALAEPFARL